MNKKRGWRELLAHPAYGNVMVIRHILTLDAAQELEPLPAISDRYVCLAEWLCTLKHFGLITGSESMELRIALAPHL